MPFLDLFGTTEHSKNLSHFAAIVSLAAVDGQINTEEEELLKRFARKLDVSEDEYIKVVETPLSFPINAYHKAEMRLERLHDLFKIIFVDHRMEPEELKLIKRYAVGLGFSSSTSDEIIEKSVKIFSGNIDFDDYVYLMRKT